MRPEILRLVDEVITAGVYHQGEHTAKLEATIATRWGGYPVATSSGTMALETATRALGIGHSDEVIVPALTFPSTAFAPAATGAIPVLVDIDPVSRTIDPAAVEAAITARTRAIFAVHMHGLMADMSTLNSLAQRHGLAVIEDCAQAAGATADGRYAGTLGTFGCFSMWVGKNMGGIADAGMLIANNEDLVPRLRMLTNLGRHRERHLHHIHGARGRMGEIDAAIIARQLDELPGWIARRRDIAARYNAAFAELPLRTPSDIDGRQHSYYKYAVRTDDAAAAGRLRESLAAQGIASEQVYPLILSQQPAFQQMPHRVSSATQSAAFAADHLCLPLYPELTEDEVDQVIIATLRHFAGHTPSPRPARPAVEPVFDEFEMREQRLTWRFELLDTNHDGVLEWEDIAELIDRLGEAYSAHPARRAEVELAYRSLWDAMVVTMDVNDDKVVTQEEYVAFLSTVVDDLDAMDQLVRPIPEAVFRMSDTDGDGVLSLAEFVALQVLHGVPEPDATDTFEALDRDASGAITTAELVAAELRHYRGLPGR